MLKLCILLLFLILPFCVFAAPIINTTTINPDLDISYFGRYQINTTINANDTNIQNVFLEIETKSGDGSSYWDFFVDGRPNSEKLVFEMDLNDGERTTTSDWNYSLISPDAIYPEIFFAPSEITMNNQPQETSIYRGNYHVFDINNVFTMDSNMSLWLEFNLGPTNPNTSSNLLIYLVGKGEDLTYFESDWRDKSSTQLVGTIQRQDPFHHTHTANSSHKIIALATNDNATIGDKNIDINNQFWIVLYQESTNTNKGWDLNYQGVLLCDTNNWYTASHNNNNTWSTPLNQQGCPDVHLHIARRNPALADEVDANIIVTYKSSGIDYNISDTTLFSFAELPNLAPNATSFIYPVSGGDYNGGDNNIINISWNPSTDPNNDSIDYNLTLLNLDSDTNTNLASGIDANNYDLDISLIDDGNYSLVGEACDAEFCTPFYLDGNFIITRSTAIYSLTSTQIDSNNLNYGNFAKTGDKINLRFTSTGTLENLSVTFYSKGEDINNSVTIESNASDNNAWFIINENDVDGEISFTISASNLDNHYSYTTDNSSVTIDNTPPVISLTPNLNTSTIDSNYLINFSITDAGAGVKQTFLSYDNTFFFLTSDENILLIGDNGDINTIYIKAQDNLDTNSLVQSVSIFFTIDEDNDGVFDNNDNLLYSENEVNATGIDLNILVNGQTTNNYFFGTKDVNFYDGETLVMNFDFNFDQNILDLNQITIIKSTNGLVVDLNGQLQNDYNKTLYITNNNFESLCVKNAPISSISDISSTCTDANEYNFTSCLTNGSYSTDGINCTLSSGVIKVENLKFSGVLGTPYPSTDSSGSVSCTPLWTCTNWSECIDGNQTRTCTKINNCGTINALKPKETQNCTLADTNTEIDITNQETEKQDNTTPKGTDNNLDENINIPDETIDKIVPPFDFTLPLAIIIILIITTIIYFKKDVLKIIIEK